MARASISGIVCFPPVITTASPGLIPTDVATMRRANRCRFGCWAVAADRATKPRVRFKATVPARLAGDACLMVGRLSKERKPRRHGGLGPPTREGTCEGGDRRE